MEAATATARRRGRAQADHALTATAPPTASTVATPRCPRPGLCTHQRSTGRPSMARFSTVWPLVRTASR